MGLSQASGASRMERKKEKTRQKIVSVALKLFKQQGFDATTMEQIAEEVDIAKGTLYNYFPVKEAILGEYIRQAFRDKSAERLQKLRSMADTRTRMKFVLGELMQGVQTQKEIFEKYLTYRVQNILSLEKREDERSGIERLATEIIRLGQQDGEIRSDLPVRIMEDQVEFVFIEVAKQFYLEPEKFNPQETIEQCVDLFLNGVKSEVSP